MKKVGFGVIGAGGIARRKTIPGLRKTGNCRLVAVMDVANVEEIAKEVKAPRFYTKKETLCGILRWRRFTLPAPFTFT